MPAHDLELQRLTQKLGNEIFDRVQGARLTPLQPQWWEERMMRLMMRDDALKVQAFRFMDVLPTMRDSRDIAQHLKEYFAAPISPRPRSGSNRRNSNSADLAELDRKSLSLADLARRWLNFENPAAWHARLIGRAAQAAAVSMAHRFIAGANLEDAERAIMRMRRDRKAFTIDLLGESAVSGVEAAEYHRLYLELIENLPKRAAHWAPVPQIDVADGGEVARVNVSVKLTAIYPGMDAIAAEKSAAAVKERLRPLLRAGMAGGAHVHIDMEHYAIKDLTLAIFREILMEPEFRDYPHFGVVLQAYLRDGDRDIAEMVEFARRRGAPLWIRLVKGAYWDTESVLADQRHWPRPVWDQKWQSDACYERMTHTLLSNHRHLRGAFGSHNVRSLAYAMALKRRLGIPGAAFELQALYGMGDPIKAALVEMGERLRVYTPYGKLLPGMAYLIRRLLENTANESFLRHSFDEGTPRDVLLRDPAETGRTTPPYEPPIALKFELGEPIMDLFENVANTDFSRESQRSRMLDAIARARAEAGREFPLVIGAQRIVTGAWRDSVNPSRPSEVIGRIAQADAATTEQAIEAAHAAFLSWRRAPVEERAECLFSVGRLMADRRFDLAALQTLECGKPWREADADVSEAIDFCNYYGKEALRLAQNVRRRDIPGESNEYFYAPRGVVAVISPWNFPLAILTGMASAAIVMGNAVIVKPAHPASVVAAGMQQLFEEAGLPPGVLNYLPGPGCSVGEWLVCSDRVPMIAFTGSREVGARINALAASRPTRQPGLKKVIAEMGGKNATIVDADADLDEAVTAVLQSAFGYAGQKCSASSRCIVLGPIYERFLGRLVEAAKGLSVGPADDSGTATPPVIDETAWKSIREYIELGKSEARLALEVDVSDLVRRSGGYFIGPTIFADVDRAARIAREEIFGPVLSVLRAEDIDDAIEIFNDTDYALTGGIFSRSPANLEKARQDCECGNFYVNRKITGALVDIQPFGGFKMSGVGSKAGGPDYLIQFCEPRCVTENTMRRGFAPLAEVAEAVG